MFLRLCENFAQVLDFVVFLKDAITKYYFYA